MGLIAKQFGHDVVDPFERVGDGTWLFEDFLLHEVLVGAELDRAAVGVDGLDLALRWLAVNVDDPVALQLQVNHVTFFEVNDLVGGTGQCHGVGGDEVLAFADADDQW